MVLPAGPLLEVGSPGASAERVIAAREALGPSVDLMADAHGKLAGIMLGGFEEILMCRSETPEASTPTCGA